MTSYSGVLLFQLLFQRMNLRERLRDAFSHMTSNVIYGQVTIFLHLLVHMLLGHRRLREMKYYRNDPMVKRIVGVRRLADVSTVSRTLAGMDERSVAKLLRLTRQLVLRRLKDLTPARITLDFDGSVISTGRFAEGTAVGYNKVKKGARSYYPLFCTVAQTGQVLDVLHRPGNVHDSRGARLFMLKNIKRIRAMLPHAVIEVRVDSAFFNEEILAALDLVGVEFTASVPFERFVELRRMIESRSRWKRFDDEVSYFETSWKPKKWTGRHRFLFIRSRSRIQRKAPVQLDLFVPHEYGYQFKVIVTNKTVSMKHVLAFHNGRGSQEALFAELKSFCSMDYVPTKRKAGNQVYLLAAVMAHNTARELQMSVEAPQRRTTQKRATLWEFKTIDTIRRQLIQRAGRITRPNGNTKLTVSADKEVQKEFLHFLSVLKDAA